MRRSISAIVLALAAGSFGIFSPLAGAATKDSPSAAPQSPGKFGTRLVDVPVSEADDPRAYRYIIDALPTGTVIHRRILIVNAEPRPARFSVYPDAAHIAGGVFVGDSGETRSELTGWISVQHAAVTLPPNASAMDMVTIKVPKGATRGEHYGVIWVQQTAKPSKGNGNFGVTEVSRVGVRVYLEVTHGGVPPTSFEIASITSRRSAAGQPVIVARVRNTGGRAVDLNGSVRLTSGPGKTTAGPFPAQDTVTLAPGQSGAVTFAPPKSLPGGSWRATVSLASGTATATATATVRFPPVVAAQAGLSAMQWIWIGLGALALAAVAVMGRYALRQRRRAEA